MMGLDGEWKEEDIMSGLMIDIKCFKKKERKDVDTDQESGGPDEPAGEDEAEEWPSDFAEDSGSEEDT
jgi:hypothetical protein